jgi:hypothetical protein
MAKENPGWGYDRIVGAMANLNFRLSDQTVGNILRRHDIQPRTVQIFELFEITGEKAIGLAEQN